MKFTTTLVVASAVLAVRAVPVAKRFDDSLVPQLGFTSGRSPDGHGNCAGAVNGANGQPIQIPCSCPPDQDTFNGLVAANVAAGKVINNPSVPFSFPPGDSTQSQIVRLQSAIVTLQNFHGPGVGCPASSTTFSAQLLALQDGTPPPPAAAPQQPPPPPPAATAAPAGFDAALVPSLGFTSGRSPDGHGNCAGAVNGANGQPIQVPCSCPPDQDTFNGLVAANVAAGKVVNNPSVPFSFPPGDSKQSQIVRLQSAIVTLQNFHGPGVGCPASSTTFSAQLKALTG